MSKKKSRYLKAVEGMQVFGFYDSPILANLDKLVRAVDLSVLSLGMELYNAHLQYPGISMRRLCFFVGDAIPARSGRFYLSLIHIHKHFVIFCGFRIEDLVGIDIRTLKSIAETKRGIFNEATTRKMIYEIKKRKMTFNKSLEYIKQKRLEIENPIDFRLEGLQPMMRGAEKVHATEKS